MANGMGFGPDDAPDGSYQGNYGGARGPRGMARTKKTPAFTKRSKYDHYASIAFAKNLIAALASPDVSVQDVMNQEAAKQANPNYGQGFYGHGVTQMGQQGQHNLSLLGSAAGLFAPGLNYPDAQALGNTMTGAPVNYPGRPTVDNQGNPIGSLESQSFNATNPGEWDFPISSINTQLGNMPEDFDLSNYFTETAESGQEFDQQAAMAALQEELALEPSTLVDIPFVPQASVVSAGAVGGGPRITGGGSGPVSGGSSVPTDANPSGIHMDGGGGEIRRRSRTPDYAAYVDMYDDLLAAQPGNMSKADWGRRHWERHGGQEGRRFSPEQGIISYPSASRPDAINVAIADPRPVNPVEYGNAFQGVSRPARTRKVYQDSASMGWT